MSHVKKHRALQSKKFTCDICSEIFARIEPYRSHMGTKHGVEIPKRRVYRDQSNSLGDEKVIDASMFHWSLVNLAEVKFRF